MADAWACCHLDHHFYVLRMGGVGMPEARILEREQAEVFATILDKLLARAELETDQLSLQMGYSQSAISLVRNGRRNLTPRMAEALANSLGGTTEDWEAIYNKLRSNTPIDVDSIVESLQLRKTGDLVTGRLTSCRLVNHQILEFFGPCSKPHFKKYFDRDEECLIENFDQTRIQPTSYDTSLGWFGAPSNGRPPIEVRRNMEKVVAPLSIKPNEAYSLATKEFFSVPSFLEMDLAPAGTLARTSLHIGSGPIIDPFYSGAIVIDVQNIGTSTVTLDNSSAFLTVRFTLLDNIPMTDEEMSANFGVHRYNLS